MACKELRTEINGKEIYAVQWDAVTALSNSALLMNSCAQYAIPFIEGKAEFDDVLRLLTNVEHATLIKVIKKFSKVALYFPSRASSRTNTGKSLSRIC